MAEAKGEVGPHGRVATAFGEIPAPAPRLPDSVSALRLQLPVERCLRVGVHLERRPTIAAHLPQSIHDIGHLRFYHEDHGRVTEPRVRAEQEEEIRKPGHRGALVRFGSFSPRVCEVSAAAAEEHAAGHQFLHLEAGGEDDDVHFALPPASIEDRAPSDLADTLCDDFDVRAGQGRVVVVRYEHPLAAHRVPGQELRAQGRVLDGAPQVAPGVACDGAHQRGLREGEHARLEEPVESPAHQLLRQRQRPIDRLLCATDRSIWLWQNPRRCALVKVEPGDEGNDLRHELDRARARADHRHALARELEIVVPFRRVKFRACEVRESLDIGVSRVAQRSHPGDDDARPIRVSSRRLHAP
jgi:hypothetical protein